MRLLEIVTGHVIYNPAYTYKFQLKTTQESENQKGAAGGTWLHTVKGRIAKTVEEKYTEYKNEKEMRKLHQQTNAHSSNLSNQFNIDGSFDDFLLENDDADEDVVVEEKDKNYLTHSLSEDIIAVSKNFDDQCGK